MPATTMIYWLPFALFRLGMKPFILPEPLAKKHWPPSCIKTPSFWATSTDIGLALSDLKGKGVLKTTEQGYDGKGQIKLATGDDAASCWAK